jgi:formamidopyrimidine-DNA glycosylase
VPELPEVEAARRGIAEQLVGKPITHVELRRPGLIVSEPGLSLDLVTGHPIDAIERYGKYMLWRFEPLTAVVHLKLTGQLVARGDGIPGFAAGHPVPPYDAELPHKSTHLWLDFEGGARLYLTDVRHFARIWLLPHEDVDAYLTKLRLGPDVLPPHFTYDLLRERMARRTTGKIKPILLDQSVVAGLGNIYVDESLWQAKVHPERTAQSLTDEELERIYQGISQTMEVAVPMGGARILRSKALPELGEFPFVHGREGLPCQRCGTTIIKTTVNNRGTYLCPTCQPAPAATMGA